jgi:hypothetical protein
VIRFRHKGCQSEVIRYVGQTPLTPLTKIDRADWQFPDCTHPQRYDILPRCPDCGTSLAYIDNARLEPIPEPETAEA